MRASVHCKITFHFQMHGSMPWDSFEKEMLDSDSILQNKKTDKTPQNLPFLPAYSLSLDQQGIQRKWLLTHFVSSPWIPPFHPNSPFTADFQQQRDTLADMLRDIFPVMEFF